MSTFNRNPIFNMQAVLRETELSADTIRVWEKRYSLPKPDRSAGGHRLYSEYDIATIKWLKARQSEGISISRAVDLWREMIGSGRDPINADSASYLEPSASAELISSLNHVRIHWLEACLTFDQVKADGLLDQAFALYPVESVCKDIMQWGLHEIGNLWFAGKVSVSQEHFTAALITKRMEAILLATPVPIRDEEVVLCGPGDEQHTFPLQLLQLYLRRRGWKVVYLGVDAPADHLVEAIAAIKPNLVVFTAQTLPAAAALKNVAALLRSNQVAVAYGGLVFNRIERLRTQIPAWYLGKTIDEAAAQIERMIQNPQVHPGVGEAPLIGPNIHDLYTSKRFQIETLVNEQVQDSEFLRTHLKDANSYFNSYLSAALELGSPEYLNEDISWIRDLLSVKNAPDEVLNAYLRMVQKAVRDVLGLDGANLTDWLESIIEMN